jgi:hypothetical protein
MYLLRRKKIDFFSPSRLPKIESGILPQRILLTALTCSLLTVGIFAGNSQAAASSQEDTIAQLEVKYFKHDYDKETLDARLDRLEKLVFGEAKEGAPSDRLAALMSIVATSQPEATPAIKSTAPSSASSADNTERTSPRKSKQPARQEQAQEQDQMGDGNLPPEKSSKYPAVTAIENKMFGKDFAEEPVNKRLERLEVKVFGHVSGADDLSYRVDRLKERTGIDVAKVAPPGSDWSEDDLDFPEIASGSRAPLKYTDPDGRSFSGRNVRRDMQQAFGAPPSTSYSSSSGATSRPQFVPQTAPSYGSPAPSYSRQPSSAPQYAPPIGQANGMGLNQQVSALEREIFGKMFAKEPLPSRLTRLESTVFPEQPPASDVPLPQRVKRLISVVPISNDMQISQSGNSNRAVDPDFGNMPDPYSSQVPQPAPQRQGGGLGKIINSIGSMLGGGGYTNGYTTRGSLVTDPQTGLLFDQLSGNLIDPLTGAIVGQRVSPMYGSGFSGFNSGFSPYGTSGFGSSGFGGSGLRFGFGSGGFYPGFGF